MAHSAVTTFGVFKSLLTNAINNDSSLDAATRSSMLARINELPREVSIALGFDTAESVAGQVTVDDLAKSIEVASGATGNNRVEWTLMTFAIPLTISGTLGARGFLPGNVGVSPNPRVADADISVEYRFSATDTFKTFDRSTVLKEVTSIQFAARIADQGSDASLPGLVFVTEQE